MNILKDLNDMQREAVETINGPVLILAGAGSGKTRVITYRIAHLNINYDLSPENILAVTFTNKAAKEMRDRIISLTKSDRFPWINTFHSTCVRILRRYYTVLGFDRNFLIYDSSDQYNLIKAINEELRIDEKVISPEAAQSFISSSKNSLKGPSDVKQEFNDYWSEKLAEIYSAYQKRLKKNNAMDFDDLLMCTVELLEENPDILNYYHDKWQYIMVDEYQDTNHAQYELIKLLAAKHQNLCVVGDDDQSIYRWRGADLTNILNFEKDFLRCLVIRLEQNYRSTKNILKAANSVVTNNISRKGKTLWTDNIEGEKIHYATLSSESEEALFICRKIKELCYSEKRQLNDFAIFYRTNAQSRVIEDMMRRESLPYDIFGGLKFYDRKEIKDIVAYLRIISNPKDDLSLERVINVPSRGIGTLTLNKIKNIAEKSGLSLYEAVKEFLKEGSFAGKSKPSKGEENLSEFIKLLDWLIELREKASVAELAEKVLEETRYIESMMAKKTAREEVEGRVENIREFLSAIEEFDSGSEDASLNIFLDQISLITAVDKYDENIAKVTLMTIHNAKGLEFPVVFMSGMEEGLFPHSLSSGDDNAVEEERRLCYVGMTRAKHRLFLTNTYRRKIYGSERMNLPSRFTKEIPAEFMELDNGWPAEPDAYDRKIAENNYRGSRPYATRDRGRSYGSYNTSSPSLNQERNSSYPPFVTCLPAGRKGEQGGFSYESDTGFSRGTKVLHPFFGKGTVIDIKGDGEDTKVTVSFINAGVKKLALKIANLEKI